MEVSSRLFFKRIQINQNNRKPDVSALWDYIIDVLKKAINPKRTAGGKQT